MPPRQHHQHPAQKPPKPPSVATCAAAAAAREEAAAAAVTAPTLAAASLPVRGTTEPAISGNNGARLSVTGSNSNPKTNVDIEGNTNIANLKISYDMDTQAEESAKHSAKLHS